jgi:hypothetical protein
VFLEDGQGLAHEVLCGCGRRDVGSVAGTGFQDADDLEGADRLAERRTTDPHLLGDDPFRRQLGADLVAAGIDQPQDLIGDEGTLFLNLVWVSFSKVISSLEIGQTGKTGLATLTETIGWCQEKCGNFIGLRGHFRPA